MRRKPLTLRLSQLQRLSFNVNTAAADKIGMTLDADYIKDAAETFDKIEVKLVTLIFKAGEDTP